MAKQSKTFDKVRLGLEYAELMKNRYREKVKPSKKKYSKKDRKNNKMKI
ncbi:MAG: hypothetical protein ACI86H_002081 [bacterium]|jgi:hypothetical protein